jgi:hypothetical protein
MLSFKNFDALSKFYQMEFTWGVPFLAGREDKGMDIRSYGLGTSYGEVFPDGHIDKITRLKTFDTTSKLMPYLAQIKFNLH